MGDVKDVGPGNDIDIDGFAHKFRVAGPYGCAQTSFGPIPGHGIANLLACGDANSRPPNIVSVKTYNKGGTHMLAALIEFYKIRSLGKRFRRFDHAPAQAQALGGQTLAAKEAATRQNFPAIFGGHAAAKTMTALANEAAWLKCTFHENTLSLIKSAATMGSAVVQTV